MTAVNTMPAWPSGGVGNSLEYVMTSGMASCYTMASQMTGCLTRGVKCFSYH